MQFYLSNGQQCVKSGNACTNFSEVIHGVPQGTVLGSHLFVVYMNVRDDYCSQNCLNLYADKTAVKQKRESTTETLSQSLNLVSDYLTQNRLIMNYDKNLPKENRRET